MLVKNVNVIVEKNRSVYVEGKNCTGLQNLHGDYCKKPWLYPKLPIDVLEENIFFTDNFIPLPFPLL